MEDVKGPLELNLLYSPATPDIDFIFVHGLGGSSRKTWSKSPLESHFWPKEWLPKEPAFEGVRIHSYGYDSQYWKGKEDCLNVRHRTLWIKGKPATGKSVLAGYLVDRLKGSGHSHRYFFFKHSDRSKSSLDRCFRSLAFQMAISDPEAFDAVLALQADGISLDHVDDRTLWRILFVQGIFQTTCLATTGFSMP